MPNVSKEFLGYYVMKKTAGQSSPSVGTQIYLPVMSVDPRNPVNNTYPGVVNRSAAPSVVVRGKKTPRIRVLSCLKASWATYVNLNSFIGGSPSYLDTTQFDTDQYGIGLYEPVMNVTRVFDGVRFSQMTVAYTAAGGPIGFALAGIGVYGDSEAASPTGFSAPTTDAGQLYNTADVTISGADQVRSMRIDILRGQGYMMYSDGTYYAAQTATGMIGGALTLEQSPTASTVPTSALTMQVGPASTGVQFVCNINLDDPVREFTTRFGTIVRSFTLIDTAAGAYPVQILQGS
jgi:hypothetical protein